MKTTKQQIQDYKTIVQETYVRKQAEEQTIKACQNLLIEECAYKPVPRASYFEFLYEQSKVIQKRWWLLQGFVLLYLWLWLSNCTVDEKERMRWMGILATVFVILMVPELWKNRRNRAIEIEQAAYYTLRQICAARMLLFAAVDFAIVTAPWNDLMVHFLLPVNVSCGICFRTFYSKWEKSKYVAVLLCLLWVGVWMMLVANETLYREIATPVWGGMLFVTLAYVVFCIRKVLMVEKFGLEECMNEVRIWTCDKTIWRKDGRS